MIKASDFRQKMRALPKDEKYVGYARLGNLIHVNLIQDTGESDDELYTQEDVNEIKRGLTTDAAIEWYILCTRVEGWIQSNILLAGKTLTAIYNELDLFEERLRTFTLIECAKSEITEPISDAAIRHLQGAGIERMASADKEEISRFYQLTPYIRIIEAGNAAIKAVGKELDFPEFEVFCSSTKKTFDRMKAINESIRTLQKIVKASAYYNDDEDMRSALLDLVETTMPVYDLKLLRAEVKVPAEKLAKFKKQIKDLYAFRNETSLVVAELAGIV